MFGCRANTPARSAPLRCCSVRPGPPQAAVVADTTGPAGEIFPRVTLLPPTNKYTIRECGVATSCAAAAGARAC